MKKSRKLLMILGIVLSLAIATGGTLAYLTDTDSDVNVMTLGNVDIEQIEQEWNEDQTELKDFTQEKPLYPYVGELGWENKEEADGAYRRFTMENVVDKYVTVENTGKSDAYVRTFFAFEMGDYSYEEFKMVGISNNSSTGAEFPFPGTWKWTEDFVAEIDGKNYNIMVAVHEKPLAPGEETIPSLLQVYLSKDADNEEVERLDGNENGFYDILVVSQAVQTAGFEDAETALNEAFGDPSDPTRYHPWMDSLGEEKAPTEYVPVTADTWDGTADTSWYNDTDTEFMIMTAEQLAGFAQLVDEGNTFEGKTVKVGQNLDLNDFNFTPIGDVASGKAFKGTFDGQNHKIGNVFYEETAHSNGNLYNSLFSYTDGATIKNLKMDDILIARYGGELAAVAGLSKDTTFENITLTNSRIAGYNNSIGGIVSEVEGNCTFKNVNVDASNMVGTFWGSYDTRVGGIVGYALGGSQIEMEDCTVACQIDSVNDACSNYMWHNYRRAGMLIGEVTGTETIDGATYAAPSASLSCANVKVIYDDWANYHYCEFERNGQGSYNAPDEFKFSRVEGTEYNGGFDVSTCEHTPVEDNHNVLRVFDQLYGGGQGVKGQPAHDGVTVVYNNK